MDERRIIDAWQRAMEAQVRALEESRVADRDARMTEQRAQQALYGALMERLDQGASTLESHRTQLAAHDSSIRDLSAWSRGKKVLVFLVGLGFLGSAAGALWFVARQPTPADLKDTNTAVSAVKEQINDVKLEQGEQRGELKALKTSQGETTTAVKELNATMNRLIGTVSRKGK